ncbi:MAG: hypothetical protein AAFU71_14115, partial [Cyanobacteria bacterium J06632_22]
MQPVQPPDPTSPERSTRPPAERPAERPVLESIDPLDQAAIPLGVPAKLAPEVDSDLQRLRTLINLVPVVGIVPSLWTLYQRDPSDPSHQIVYSASRTAVVLALSWVSATVLLGAGANLPLSHGAT